MVLNITSYDVADISFRRNSVLGQINNVLYYFNQVDAVPKLKILKSYCGSLYGCELWNLFFVAISDISYICNMA